MTMPVKYFAPKVTVNWVSLIFPPRDNRGKIMNNLNACSAHNYLYPRSPFKTGDQIPFLKDWFSLGIVARQDSFI